MPDCKWRWMPLPLHAGPHPVTQFRFGAMTTLRMASFNLFNYAVPGIFWHERDGGLTYEEDQWDSKRRWIAETLAVIDADIVAFQEVVSVEDLRSLVVQAGYPHFASVTEPRFLKNDADVFVNSTVAIASRHRIASAQEIKTFDRIIDQTLLDRAATYSRRPLRCVIDCPDLGPTVVYSAHFKSQGAFFNDEIVDVIEDWDTRIDTFFVERMFAGIDQVSKRAAEAGALYLQVREDLKADTEAPVVILGDLNEGPRSHTLSILTQADPIFAVGSTLWTDVPDAHRFRRYTHRLYDAYALPPHAELERPVTYHANKRASILDYAIVSNGLNPANPRHRGAVVRHEVFDAHFDLDQPRRLTSDHAPVIVTIEPRKDEPAQP